MTIFTVFAHFESVVRLATNVEYVLVFLAPNVMFIGQLEKDIVQRARSYYSFQTIKHSKIPSKQSNKVLRCHVTNSQLEHTTAKILGLYVPNLQILIMEWQNVDLQITQFG